MATHPVLESSTKSAPARQIPGPRGAPVLGNIAQFRKDPLNFILKMAHDFGPVARYRFGNVEFIQVSHPDGVRRILQENNHNYIKGAQYEPIRSLAGNGLFLSEGSFWLRQRRLMQPSFHRQQLSGFAGIITTETAQLVQRWRGAARDKQIIDVMGDMAHLTMQVVTQALFSTQVSVSNQIDQAITVLNEDFSFRFEVPFYPSPRVPTPRNRRHLAAMRTMDQIIYNVIHARREMERNGREAPHDLLALLMDATDADTGERMNDRQLRDEILIMFIAGHETTANALTWTWYLLSQHLQVLRRLEAEVDTLLSGRAPQVSDLPNLPYTRMVIEEAMRLYPPAWIFSRSAVQDDTILGYRIPAGAVVAVSPYVTHRDPLLWEDPETFDPERFTPERSAGRPHFAYFPFGGGPRQCIGQGFAMMEAHLILATLAQQFQLNLVPNFKVYPRPASTLRPVNGLQMRVATRTDG